MSNRSKLTYGLPPETARLLHNNDLRVDYQVSEIKDSLVIAQSLKSDLRAQITEMRMNLMRLEREELHATRHIERCEFALAPIRRIPTEILQHIFLCYADLLGDNPPCIDVKGGVWILGHICSYWRAVALSTPDLWTACAFSCYPHKRPRGCCDAPSLVRTWFERAGRRPLSIRFNCDAPAIDQHPRDAKEVCKSVFEIVLDHRREWTDVQLGSAPSFLSKLESVRNEFPSLKKLVLLIDTMGAFDETQTLSVFSGAPQLHDVSLHFIGSRSQQVLLPWRQIKSYKGPFSLNEASHVLSDAPDLVDCEIYPGGGDPLPSNPLLVHRLQNLHLMLSAPRPEFVTLPSLQRLRLSAIDDTMLPSVERLLQRSMAAPTSLHIDDFVFSPELIALLAAAPTITDLTLRSRASSILTITLHARAASVETTNLFFDCFLDSEDGSKAPALPALQRLSLQGIAFGESMVRVLEARCCPPGDQESSKWEGARLESLTIADVRNTHISHLLRIKRLEREAGLKLFADSLSAVRILPSN
ncbi:hypothetical protein B0H11DRAFT_1336314 [Mycena galericulata]|nr:hypothetical protein B0H11DRAFT_1336314 [Mycena galericulata]